MSRMAICAVEKMVLRKGGLFQLRRIDSKSSGSVPLEGVGSYASEYRRLSVVVGSATLG